VGLGLFAAILLHAAVAGVVVGWGLLQLFTHPSWGQPNFQSGSVQAQMVDALPLPSKQRFLDKSVLTSETPSAAPTPPSAKTEPPPQPNEILLGKTKPVKTADKSHPEPPKHPQPVPLNPKKATMGETAGIQIPQAVMQLKNGTATMTVDDRNFGDRYPYYVKIVTDKVASDWYAQEADPRASDGKKVTITMDIDRDGVPTNPRITGRSGSPTLDMSALRAVQRVDSFGPLPQGNKITVQYTFLYKQP
jgi:protein TonB